MASVKPWTFVRRLPHPRKKRFSHAIRKYLRPSSSWPTLPERLSWTSAWPVCFRSIGVEGQFTPLHRLLLRRHPQQFHRQTQRRHPFRVRTRAIKQSAGKRHTIAILQREITNIIDHWSSITDLQNTALERGGGGENFTAGSLVLGIEPGELLFAANSTRKQQVYGIMKAIETNDQTAFDAINPTDPRYFYIQHSLAVEDGLVGVKQLLQTLHSTGHARVDPIRIFQDGDYVFVHTHFIHFFGHKFGFDIFRYEDGFIVEHWGMESFVQNSVDILLFNSYRVIL